MRSGWNRVALGEIATQEVEPFDVHPDGQYINLGVQWYAQGVFARPPKRGSEMKATRLFRVRPGQFIYNRMFVTEGSFGVVRDEHAEGVISSEFPVFAIDGARLLTDYLELYFQQPEVWKRAAGEATGTTKSRRRWKEAQFLAHEVALPPVEEQRRIVDLIGAVDGSIDAAEGEARAATNLLDALLSDAPTANTRTIGEVASLGSGASWGKAAVRGGPDEDATPVITIANTKPTGVITGAPTYVMGLSENTRLVQPGSLIAIRTNGNHDRIGNVYRATEAQVGAAVSAFQFIIDAIDARDADYLYWMMRSPSFQARVTDAASGSTGLGNIAISKVRQMDVPWPASAAERQTLTSRFEAVHRGGGAARATADALRALRSNLLTVLLSGKREIPASYDRLLEEAA